MMTALNLVKDCIKMKMDNTDSIPSLLVVGQMNPFEITSIDDSGPCVEKVDDRCFICYGLGHYRGFECTNCGGVGFYIHFIEGDES